MLKNAQFLIFAQGPGNILDGPAQCCNWCSEWLVFSASRVWFVLPLALQALQLHELLSHGCDCMITEILVGTILKF